MSVPEELPNNEAIPSGSTAPVTRPPSASEAELPPTRIVADVPSQAAPTVSHSPEPLAAPVTTVTEEPRSERGGALPDVPGYEILQELGRGGMGVVYKAIQVQLKRVVALKMLLGPQASEAERSRFRAEGEAVARLQHPNIVQIHEVGEFNGQPYFSLEFVEGGSLDQYLRGKPQAPRDSATLLRVIALGVEAAHEKQIIHRDLKPANVLMASGGRQSPDSEGTGDSRPPLATPKITDFGLAKQLDADVRQTIPGAVMGTPPYMAPEQARGRIREIGPWTDVYALGAVLYEMLCGRPPFNGQSSWEILEQVREQDPVPIRDLQPRCPRDLEIICLKCLQKSPKARYRSARELADDLGRWLDNRPILARPAGVVERSLKWIRRSPLKAAGLAVVLTLVALGVAVLYLRSEAAQKDADLATQRNALLEEQAENRQRELAEQQRRERVRERFSRLFAQAAQAEREGRWSEVAQHCREALTLIAGDAALADSALRAATAHLKARAEGKLADEKQRLAERGKLEQLRRQHGDAVFFATLFSGLELEESFERVREAVRAGLALFGVTLDGKGPPALDPRYFDEADTAFVVNRCYELLLLDAEVLAQDHQGETGTERQNRFRAALERLERAQRLGLRTRAALVRTADCREKLGDVEAARQLNEAAAELPPATGVDFFLLGRDRFRDYRRRGEDRDLSEAASQFVAALRQQPDHFGARYLLAVCRAHEKRWQEVRVNVTACLEQRPEFLWPLLLRGFAALALREYTEAEADFDRVLQQSPDDMARFAALVNRAVLAVSRQQWDRASADLQAALRIKDDARIAYQNLALVHKTQSDLLGRAEAATLLGSPLSSILGLAALRQRQRELTLQGVAELDRGIDRCKDVARLHHERARLHLQLGHAAQARRDLVRAIALAPATTINLANDLLELGRLMQQSEEYATALTVYDALVKLRRDQVFVQRLRAEVLLALHRYAEAAEALDHYLAAPTPGPRNAEEVRRRADAWTARGLLHARAGDSRAAIACYTQSLQLRQDVETLTRRGWDYLVCAAPVLALADFEEALKVQAHHVDALVGRADALVKLGKVTEALADAEEGGRNATTARLKFLAARVHAQAAPRLRDAAGERAQTRVAELLREALLLVPVREQAGFWRENVEKDAVLAPLLRSPIVARVREHIRYP